MTVSFVCFDQDVSSRATPADVGGKAWNLLQLAKQRQPVPRFYVVTTRALRAALAPASPAGYADELLDRLAKSNEEVAFQLGAELQDLILRMELPADTCLAIQTAHEERFEERAVAVRSSAVGEDSSRHSFAGMHESVLDVCGRESVCQAIRQVWASCFSERAIAYRRLHGLGFDIGGMAVVVQQMIDARQSGVMFTCHPVTGSNEEVYVDAVTGSGDKLVQGTAVGTVYRVRKSDRKVVSDPAPRPAQAILSESQLSRVVEAGIAVEQFFGSPQDVEFCFGDGGEFYVLQTRPITTDSDHSAATSYHQVWDNSNIIESYSGVTTPLTFSFIRRAYGIVYQTFAEVMGVSPRVVRAHGALFNSMLGMFRGRVYYNLKNWYRLVRLFPGYQYNRGFMEAMMGVREPLVLDDDVPKAGFVRRWFVELPSLIVLAARITWRFVQIRSTVDKFQRYFDEHYTEWSRIDFRRSEPHELLTLYRHMEDKMLRNWKAPIINDFFVMVFYGILKMLCVRWCGDESGSLQNRLLCATGGVESAKPAWLLLQLTRVAGENQPLRELILHEPLDSLPQRVAEDLRFHAFQSLLDEFLEEYGLRCPNELKLESLTYRDRPELVYQMVQSYLVLENGQAADPPARLGIEKGQRQEAERAAYKELKRSGSWLPRAAIFRFVLARTREGVRRRENLRFARTKIYNIARNMFRALGDRFAREGILDDASDVFYLTTEEIWDYVQGAAVSVNLGRIAEARRFEYDGYRSSDIAPPAKRFETHGIPYYGNDYHGAAMRHQTTQANLLLGTSCCPGVVVGTVQICDRPVAAAGIVGDILVAESTDPGWVTMFPAFRGILVERGSVLSHSAIVAREMGIPTIVGVTSLMARLRTGQRVRMDGARATIDILSEPDVEDCSMDDAEAHRDAIAATG